MKSLNYLEWQQLVYFLKDHVLGSQLQDIWVWDKGLQLGLYQRLDTAGSLRGMKWLVLDFSQQSPFIFFADKDSFFKKMKKNLPLQLFLQAHAENQFLIDIVQPDPQERIIIFCFGKYQEVVKEPEKEADYLCQLHLQMIPRNVNASAVAAEKKIFWNKPLPLPDRASQASPYLAAEVRSIPQLMLEWKKQYQDVMPQLHSSKPALDINFEKLKAKKEKIIVDLQTQLQNLLKNNHWAYWGEYLKVNGMHGAPTEAQSFMDLKNSLSWNIQNCFDQSKQMDRKIQGLRLRITQLQQELQADFKQKLQSLHSKVPTSQELNGSVDTPLAKSKKSLSKSLFKFRSLDLDSGRKAMMGKSAADNLGLLRQASPWFLWMHIQDYPGAHVIIETLKNSEVLMSELQEVARWLISQHLAKTKKLQGRYTVVYTEVRFVKPIRGDKLGRVVHHHGKILSVDF